MFFNLSENLEWTGLMVGLLLLAVIMERRRFRESDRFRFWFLPPSILFLLGALLLIDAILSTISQRFPSALASVGMALFLIDNARQDWKVSRDNWKMVIRDRAARAARRQQLREGEAHPPRGLKLAELFRQKWQAYQKRREENEFKHLIMMEKAKLIAQQELGTQTKTDSNVGVESVQPIEKSVPASLN